MSVLDQIFQTKREEIELLRQRGTLRDWQIRASQASPVRGFRRMLEISPEISLIAEVKKASPSEGVIREDFDPKQIARAYAETDASCLSVLTDVQYFQGAPENIRLVRESNPLPVLRKDFICDELQIYESRALGADAILLIASHLSVQELTQFRGIAESLRMDALVEVHNEEEANNALLSGATLIGVNNRDLSTFQTDLSLGERLIPQLTGSATVVAESAIQTNEDVRRMEAAGAQAVLIGTTFCRAEDIVAKVNEVMGWGRIES